MKVARTRGTIVRMHRHVLESDIHVFIGEDQESVATAFFDGDDVLLVDALASRADACRLRDHFEDERKHVRQIVLTHAMSDHMVFDGATVLAHRFQQHTFLSQQPRDSRDYDVYVDPDILVGDEVNLRWGRHALRVLHNPGKTMDMLAIDVPNADLAIVGDAIVGNTAYLSRAAPDLVDLAIGRLIALSRSRVVPGHMGCLDGGALTNARQYLARLRAVVRALPRDHAFGDAVRKIAIESCVARGVQPTAFERHWHARNLDVIVEQRVLELDASGARAKESALAE